MLTRINNVLFAIPLRSHINHPFVLWTDKENHCGLDFSKAVKILQYCKERGIKCSFGIGTNLTCDVYAPDGSKYDAENIVMKMSRCRMNPNQSWYLTIKISDDLGKHMGDNQEFNHACYELNIPVV